MSELPPLPIVRMVHSMLQKRTAQVFILLIKFLRMSLFSRSFQGVLRYSLCSKCLNYFSIWTFDCFFLIWQLCSSYCLFLFIFLNTITHFSIPNTNPISWQFILIVCIRITSSISISAIYYHYSLLLLFLIIKGFFFVVLKAYERDYQLQWFGRCVASVYTTSLESFIITMKLKKTIKQNRESVVWLVSLLDLQSVNPY